LTGLFMPQDNPNSPGPQLMEYNKSLDWFSAGGISITPLDDNFGINP